MNLTDLMDSRLVEMDLVATDPCQTLRILVDRMVKAGFLKSSDDALRRLEEREKVMSTGIGGGIAIPHARSPEVRRTLVALGRSLDGVPFNAVDKQPVMVVFLILGPPDSSSEHVKVLGRIARLVKQPEFLGRAAEAHTPEDVLSLVKSYE